MRRLNYVLTALSSSHGKGCILCYVCGKWLGPPYNFHRYDCPVAPLLKKIEELEKDLPYETHNISNTRRH